MLLKAVLTSSAHPEYGGITVSFPIPDAEYDHTIELLERLGIGDALEQDCRAVHLESRYPVLKRLEGTPVNVDELDYLAKRLDSFCKGECDQFQAMAHKLELADIRDFINLTFCCQQATVITDFSRLERIGREHCMNVNGGTMPMDAYNALDGQAEALKLILHEKGAVTPYGVVYDNGMELEPLYDGRQFPVYLYEPPVLALETVLDGGAGYFCLPMPERQLQRTVQRAGLAGQDVPLRVVIDELPEKAAEALDLKGLRSGDLSGLNRLCRAMEVLKELDRESPNGLEQFAEVSDSAAPAEEQMQDTSAGEQEMGMQMR